LYVYNHDKSLIKYLTRAGKTKRNNRANPQNSRLREAEVEKKRIDKRSEACNSRQELGHLESDFMVSCRGGKACLLVAVDRKSREAKLRRLPNREADTARRALFQIFSKKSLEERKSLTVDNDTAHGRSHRIKHHLESKD